jgi:hypothetical protein
MSQVSVNVVAPLGYTGPTLPGSNSLVQIVDTSGNPVLESGVSDVTVNNNLKVNNILPRTGNNVDVNGILLRSLSGGPGTVNHYIGTLAPTSLTANANLMVGSGGSGITTGSNNTVLGLFSGGAISTGDDNVVVGVAALTSSALGSENVAIGKQAIGLVGNSSFGQVAVGSGALKSILSVTSSPNTAIGWRSLWNTTSSGANTALGAGSGQSVTTGSNNTFLGVYAGEGNGLTPTTTGSNNICIGSSSGPAASSTSDSITLGNSSNNILRCAVTSITSLSDARDKKDITDLSAGLDFVNKLKPVEFVWNDRDENGKHDVADFGFIAQDLKASQEEVGLAETLKLVYEENPEKLEASYGKLVPILVKAIQEMSSKMSSLEKELEILKTK